MDQAGEAAGESRATPFPALAGTAEAAEILVVRNQQVAKLAGRHADFPRPVQALAAGPVYLREEIEAWGRNWSRKRTGRPRAKIAESREQTD